MDFGQVRTQVVRYPPSKVGDPEIVYETEFSDPSSDSQCFFFNSTHYQKLLQNAKFHFSLVVKVYITVV